MAFVRQVVEPGRLGPVEQRAPAEPGPGEVLVRNMATSLNYHDIAGIRGALANTPFPRVPFSDNAGIVEAVGSGVEGVETGDRVMSGFFPRWLSGEPDHSALSIILGDQIDGALRSHMVVAASSLVHVPSHLDFLQASTLGCAGLTAWRALATGPDPLKAGQSVLIQGTGGVSLFAIALAKSMGAQVIVISSADSKLEHAKALGADVGINYSEHEGWHKRVLEVTGGRGVDSVVEVAGGATLVRSIAACSIGGRISVIGVLTGREAAEFPLSQVMAKNQTLAGITVGSIAQFRDFARAVEQNRLYPTIDRTFQIGDVEQAMALMLKQEHVGKIVIDLADPSEI